MTALVLGDVPLGLEDFEAQLGTAPPVLSLADDARQRVAAGRAVVEQALAEGRVVYGINTGFGKLSNTVIPAGSLKELQVNLVRSHAAGVGPALPLPVCRLACALRLASLSSGHSGVRPALIDHGLAVLNAGIVPVMPSQGSVGASGDLAPLAHMALVLIGRGRAWCDGEELDGGEALRRAGLQPFELDSKEGLALLNGTQVSTALLIDAALAARRLARAADVGCAMTLEAYKGTATAYDARLHELRGHAGQMAVAANLRRLLEGSNILPSHRECARVQDPYSLRCAPQVHGASRDTLDHVLRVIEIEANAVTDNPIVFPEGDVLSGGNFHAQPVALAADSLKTAAAEFANIAERRIELLLNPDVSGLPPFLARDSGLHSGLMMSHVAAAALVSENKVLAHPASVDSIPTSAGKEDHVSMATAAARQARQIVTNATMVTAIELMTALHALAFEEQLQAGRGVTVARDVLAAVIPPLTGDRELSPDMEAAARTIDDGTLLAAVEAAVGSLT